MFIWAHQSVMGTPIGPTSSRLALVSTRHKVQKSSRENVMNMDSQVEGRLQNVCQAHEINKKKHASCIEIFPSVNSINSVKPKLLHLISFPPGAALLFLPTTEEEILPHL